VYFDEMGPPWPKHPCTDAQLLARGGDASSRSAYRMRLSPGTVAHADDFRRRFTVAPAQAYEVEDISWNGHYSWLHVRRVGWLRWRTVFVIPQLVPRVAGQLVFVSRGRLSLLHPTTLKVLEFPVITG